MAPLASTLEINDYLLQHGARIDIANTSRRMARYVKT